MCPPSQAALRGGTDKATKPTAAKAGEWTGGEEALAWREIVIGLSELSSLSLSLRCVRETPFFRCAAKRLAESNIFHTSI